jgi:hypothetical protein
VDLPFSTTEAQTGRIPAPPAGILANRLLHLPEKRPERRCGRCSGGIAHCSGITNSGPIVPNSLVSGRQVTFPLARAARFNLDKPRVLTAAAAELTREANLRRLPVDDMQQGAELNLIDMELELSRRGRRSFQQSAQRIDAELASEPDLHRVIERGHSLDGSVAEVNADQPMIADSHGSAPKWGRSRNEHRRIRLARNLFRRGLAAA